jgi:ribosome-binding protein aMBF1 (putative translation factor)
MTEYLEKTTQTAQMVSAKMEALGISIRDLAYKVDTTYEHIRRLVRGEAVPSKHL